MGRVPPFCGITTVRKPRGTRYPKKQLRKLFEDCDTNGDGKLSKRELKEGFNKLGAFVPGFRAWQGMDADGNGDGFIDLHNEEFDELVKFAYSLGFTLK